MGKILDTLRRSTSSILTPPQRIEALGATAPRGDVAPISTPNAYSDEQPSFIEIGPKREIIAASPSVLAASVGRKLLEEPKSSGDSRPASATAPVAPQRDEAGGSKIAGVSGGPHSVLFRSLPTNRPADPAPAVLRRPKVAADIVTYHTPDHPIASRYVELFNSIREAASVKAAVDHLVMLFAPIRPQIGTTTVLLNIAVVAARQNRRTLVVDANIKRPAVAERLGLATSPGWMEVLEGEIELDEAICPTDLDGLFALPAGQTGPLLADTRTVYDILGKLRERFDLVMIDGPRWEGRGSSLALAGGCDAVFLVSSEKEADSPPMSDLMRQLPQQGVRLAGSILTASR